MRPLLSGIIPPLVSPLSSRDEIDQAGLARLIEHVLAGGVHGLFLLGTTGEAPSLSYRLRRELIDRVTTQVAGRVPILVGITDTSFVESVRLAEHAAQAGATALVLSTPYYFPAGQTELTGYIENLVPELPLPLVLYNMPSLTKVWFEIETLIRLAAIPKIIGLKDSSGDLAYFQKAIELKKIRPDWSIMIGPEAKLPDAMRMGGDGGVAGGGNIFPKLFVDCYNACVSGDSVRVEALQSDINALQQIYEVGKYASKYIKATKCCLSLLGICDDFMAEPFHRFRAPERERVRAILDSLSFRGGSGMVGPSGRRG
ncbi:MAG: dihydrodipicolinate synthase family protein [Planctomycetota bacterium]|nr:dihydrodipicolinate synthase family protein [Planctomycetota bacterium]